MYRNVLFVFLLIISACSNEQSLLNSNEKDSTANTVQISQNENNTIDTVADNFAKFLSGQNTSQYASTQNAEFYKEHQKEINASWTELETNTLDKIKNWVSENKITKKSDTITLFYPFSGPDFVFANSFFPYCKDYIFFGLENPGSIPQLKNLQDSTLKAYLENLRYSLQYTNKNGYFLTKQMKEIFKNVLLDGATQLILFYISKFGYDVTEFQPFYLDPFGNPVNQEKIILTDKNVQGIRIGFKDEDVNKTLYYFQLDVSNINLTEHLEFVFFLNSFKNKITYMKSASYLLHRKEFTMIKDIVLTQSFKILQDDSGIPFESLQNADYNIDIFGNYTKTINLFKERYQSDLRNAVSGTLKKSDLPFNIGYNVQFDETVLIYAKNNRLAEKNEEDIENQLLAKNPDYNKVIYKVQIKIVWDKLPEPETVFKGLSDIDYYFDGSYYKYTTGYETSEEDCQPILKLAVEKGYKDAFIAAFYQGQRITLDEAKKIQTK